MKGEWSAGSVPPVGHRSSSRHLLISVVIPSYLRPAYLIGCLRALAGQTRPAEEVIVVLRQDDLESRRALKEFITRDGSQLAITSRIVSQPGFLPPITAGIQAAMGDVIAFVDDDAEPLPDWLERLESHYVNPRVGGVGGRCLNIENGREVRYPVASRVGRFYWFGRAVGNMYREVAGSAPRPVDFFMGGNMSYRREALRQVQLDGRLNRNVAYHYEIDLGLQVKKLGYELVYDPLAKIRHFSAPRPLSGMRVHSRESVYFASHNLLYIALKHTAGVRRWLVLVYAFLIGGRHDWGLAAIVVESLGLRCRWRRELGAALQGKMDAVREVIRKQETSPAYDRAPSPTEGKRPRKLVSWVRRLTKAPLNILRECWGGARICADYRSQLRLSRDIFLSRFLFLVPSRCKKQWRTITARSATKLCYRLDRGDLQGLREVWFQELYRLPFRVVGAGVLLDLGANIGLTSIWLARRYGFCRIVAVEPDPDNAALLRQNFRLNGIAGEVIEAAVGPYDGTAKFARSECSNLGKISDAGISIRVVSVESLLRSLGIAQVDLVKVDIEGGEQDLFLGPSAWLQHTTSIIIEFHPRLVDYPKLTSVLERKGFAYFQANTVFKNSMDYFCRRLELQARALSGCSAPQQ